MTDDKTHSADLGALITALHDSEINGSLSVSWFYDSVWTAKLGDDHNGVAAKGSFRSLRDTVEWLRSKAIELYPDSQFAKSHRRGFE
jgi:hypothetical protein